MDAYSIQASGSLFDLQSQSGLADFALYKLVNNYFVEEINQLGFALMRRMMAWVVALALSLATLYFVLMGYRIATGQSREPMMGLVVNSLKLALVLSVASSMAFGNVDLYRFLTTGLDREVHALVSGKDGQTSVEAVDENLAYLQIALNAIDAVKVVDGDEETRERKSRALLMAGVGSASVPMTVGALMLMYKFGIAFFVGLAPLFILCLIFDQTRELFRKWLMSGIATFFAMAALSVMSAMALKLAGKIAVAFWVSKAIGGIAGLQPEGMTTLAIQHGGIGLTVTVLLISVPPMVGAFFHGALGNFMTHSAFSAGSYATAGPQDTQRHHATPGGRDPTEKFTAPGYGAASARFNDGALNSPAHSNEVKKK